MDTTCILGRGRSCGGDGGRLRPAAGIRQAGAGRIAYQQRGGAGDIGGCRLVARVPGRPQSTNFPKEVFVFDLARGTCTCPAGQVTRYKVPMVTHTDLPGLHTPAKRQDSGLRARCAPPAGDDGAQAGRPDTTGDPTGPLLALAPRRKASCIGPLRWPISPWCPANFGGPGNYGRHRHSLLTCIRGWLMSPTLPLSLFPNRTFRPTLLGSQERLGFAHRPGSRCIASLVFSFSAISL